MIGWHFYVPDQNQNGPGITGIIIERIVEGLYFGAILDTNTDGTPATVGRLISVDGLLNARFFRKAEDLDRFMRPATEPETLDEAEPEPKNPEPKEPGEPDG